MTREAAEVHPLLLAGEQRSDGRLVIHAAPSEIEISVPPQDFSLRHRLVDELRRAAASARISAFDYGDDYAVAEARLRSAELACWDWEHVFSELLRRSGASRYVYSAADPLRDLSASRSLRWAYRVGRIDRATLCRVRGHRAYSTQGLRWLLSNPEPRWSSTDVTILIAPPCGALELAFPAVSPSRIRCLFDRNPDALYVAENALLTDALVSAAHGAGVQIIVGAKLDDLRARAGCVGPSSITILAVHNNDEGLWLEDGPVRPAQWLMPMRGSSWLLGVCGAAEPRGLADALHQSGAGVCYTFGLVTHYRSIVATLLGMIPLLNLYSVGEAMERAWLASLDEARASG